MPEGRFLSKSIAHSEQLESVPLEADYLFMRCIPHLDREGRMPGHPDLVKALACPLRPEINSGLIPDLLRTLGGAGLVRWYESDGKKILEFPGFERHQKGAKLDREAPSRFPPYDPETTPDLLRTNSGPGPDEVRVSEVEVKSKSKSPPPTPSPRDEWWKRFKTEYPRRSGDQGWKEGRRRWNARLKEGRQPEDLAAAATRYRRYCEALGKLDTQFIKRASTFLNDPECLDSPWDVPEPDERKPGGRPAMGADEERRHYERHESEARRRGKAETTDEDRARQLDARAKAWMQANLDEARQLHEQVKQKAEGSAEFRQLLETSPETADKWLWQRLRARIVAEKLTEAA